jgi:hypothetical protein
MFKVSQDNLKRQELNESVYSEDVLRYTLESLSEPFTLKSIV